MDEMNAFTTEKLPVHTRQTMDWTSGTPVVERAGSTIMRGWIPDVL
jgi:hypothetical protein